MSPRFRRLMTLAVLAVVVAIVVGYSLLTR